ncbi:biotin/lipoyl-containing protein [Gordonia humi]
MAAVAAALAQSAANRGGARVLGSLPSGWRNIASDYQSKRYVTASGEEVDARYRIGRRGVDLPDLADSVVESIAADVVTISTAGVTRRYEVSVVGAAGASGAMGDASVNVDWPGASVALTRVPRYTDPSAQERPGSLLAPMPGSVIRVAVAEGDTVTAGQPLLWLEAMKMEHTIAAPSDGVVSVLAVEEGRQLSVGDVLAVITEAE